MTTILSQHYQHFDFLESSHTSTTTGSNILSVLFVQRLFGLSLILIKSLLF